MVATIAAASASPTLVAQAVSAPGAATEAVRAALERAYRLPSYTPSAGGGLPGNLARGAGLFAAFLAGRYLTSEGELNLAKDTGQIPGYVTQRHMQDASAALSGAGIDGTQFQGLSADRKGRLIVGAAELQQLAEAGTISAQQRNDGIASLIQGLTAAPADPRSGAAYGPSLDELQRGAQQQQRENDTTRWPPAATPTEVLPAAPGAPSRIGGVSADRVPYSEAALQQATGDAQRYNAQSNTRVALGYAVRDAQSGQWFVERIAGISPSSARSLVWNLNQRGQLAHPSEDVFRSSGIGGWRTPEGGIAGAETDLQVREANAYFKSLTPAQVTAAAQAGALQINGQRGSVYPADAAGALAAQITGRNGAPGLNDAARGNVSLAIQREYDIPGPNHRSTSVRGIEVFADLTPAEARAVLNAAARDGSLVAPAGTDAIDWNLAQNGLSRAGLDQRDASLRRPPAAAESPARDTPDTPDPQKPQTPQTPQLPQLPPATPLPGGSPDIQRVAEQYGVSPYDIVAVMQANPGMSPEQAAQYLKGSLLASSTGNNAAVVPPAPPNNGGSGAVATGTGDDPAREPDEVTSPDAPALRPDATRTIDLLNPQDLGFKVTEGSDGTNVVHFDFSGPTGDLERAKWQASGWRIHDARAPNGQWQIYVSDANGEVIGFVPNARLANAADGLWQTIQHNAAQIADPGKRDAYIGKWRAAINAIIAPSPNPKPPSDIANQVRRLAEIEQAERERQVRQGAGEEIILPADDPRLPENRRPPWLQP